MKKKFKKSIHVIAIALVFVTLVGNVSFGASDSNQQISGKYAETDAEIVIAEERLNDILQLATQKEIQELNSINEKTINDIATRNDFIDKKERTIESLETIQSIEDIVPSLIVKEAEEELLLNNDPINEDVLSLCQEIEAYKNSNQDQDTKEIIKYFNEKHGLEARDEEVGFIDISIGNFAYAFPYEDEWTDLTTQEKVLFVTFPADALLVKSAAEKAYDWTVAKWGVNGIGDKSDGYRHATWNALMKRSSGNSMATLFATAHEDVPGDELYNLGPDGYLLYKHAMMDLKNNEIGRGLVYASDVNVSDSTLKSRASAKMSTSTTSFYYAPTVSNISELPIVSGSKIVYMHN